MAMIKDQIFTSSTGRTYWINEKGLAGRLPFELEEAEYRAEVEGEAWMDHVSRGGNPLDGNGFFR
jgi:hypothetical protein